MFKTAKPLFLIVQTPLHTSSERDVGIVDLLIQRENHTGYPQIEALGLKRRVRAMFNTQTNQLRLERRWQMEAGSEAFEQAISLAFGPDDKQAPVQAGALDLTDARLLLFPVQSVSGVFAWVTCPFVIERFKHDLSLCGVDFPCRTGSPPCVPANAHLIVNEDVMVLEERTFAVSRDPDITVLAEWLASHLFPKAPVYGYWREKLRTDLVVLPDRDFRDFVTLSTPVIARIDVSRPDAVEDNAVSYEEYLPADAILYALVLASPIFQKREVEKGVFRLTELEKAKAYDESEKVMAFFEDGLPAVMQIGGRTTLGKGVVRTHMF